MEEFFKKYPIILSEKDALTIIHTKVCLIEELYAKAPESIEYLNELAKLIVMVNDFFVSKGLSMTEYPKQIT